MRKFSKHISFIMIVCLLVGSIQFTANAESALEDGIAAEIKNALGADYEVNVQVCRKTKGHIRAQQFNSRQTNWFGYYLSDVDIQMEGKKWVFTVDENGETSVEAFEEYDDTYDVALQNVAIGAGIIIICVTVSSVSGGLGAPAVSAIFLASAKNASIAALSSGAFSGIVAGVSTAVQTNGDMDATRKAAAEAAGSSFLWGAISGAVVGGVAEASALHSGTASGLTMNEVAQIRNETKWSTSKISKFHSYSEYQAYIQQGTSNGLTAQDVIQICRDTDWSIDTISKFKSIDEYNVYKNANLREVVINNKPMLIRDIDLDYKSELSDEIVTNLERMSKGYAPIDPATGNAYQLHHVNQEVDGVLSILTCEEHLSNASILNQAGKEGVHSQLRSLWDTQRHNTWKALAQYMGGN